MFNVELLFFRLQGPFSDTCQEILGKNATHIPKKVARRESEPGPPVSHKVVGADEGLCLASKNRKRCEY